MKRIVLLSILLMVVSFYGNGQISKSVAAYRSDIQIEKSDEYDRIALENSFHTTDAVGLPELPVYVQSFVVPIDAQLDGVTVNGVNRQKLEGSFYVYPVQPPIPASAVSDAGKFTPPNPAVYSSSKPYPGKQAEIISDELYLGYRIVTIQLYPVEYIPSTRELYLCSFNFSIDCSENAKQAKGREFEMQTQSLYRYEMNRKNVKFRVENPEAVDGYNTKVQRVIEGDSVVYDFTSISGAKGGNHSQTVSVLNERIPDYIIVTSSTLKPAFQTLANWKTKKGIFTIIVTAEEIDANYMGSDLQEKIRNYLIEANTKWGAGLYVLLGGDVNTVPARLVRGDKNKDYPADRYYYTSNTWNIHHDNVFNSNSSLSIINILGRIPVSNAQEVTAYTNKVISYEKAALGDLNYLKNHLYADAYIWRSGYLAVFAIKAIKTNARTYSSSWINHRFICDNADCSGDPAWYTPSGSDCGNGNTNGDIELNRTNFLSCLNSGANLGAGKFHFVYHMDHSSATGVGTSSKDKNESIGRADADNLTNGTSYQIMMSGGCNPANFRFDCFGKHYIMNPTGGGVAFIGNTDIGWSNEHDQLPFFLDPLHTSTNHPNMGRFDIGGAFQNIISKKASSNWRLHLLGEPEMQVWTNVPQTFTVTLPSSVSTGQSSVSVNIAGLNLPSGETALICLQKGSEVYETRMVSGNGSYTFSVSPATTGVISVTVTAHNYFPVEKSVPVAQGIAPNPVIGSVNFVDDGSNGSIGNGNGQNDAGETVCLQVEVKNTGGSATNNMMMVALKSTSIYINVLNKAAYLQPIASGGTAVAQFVYQIDKDTPEILSNATNPVQFELWFVNHSPQPNSTVLKRTFNIDVFATNLQQRNKEIINTAGNVVTFNMELQNVGKALSTPLTATLTAGGAASGSSSYPAIGRFGTKTATSAFRFTVPAGYTATTTPLKLDVTSAYGKTWSFDFTLSKPDTVSGLDFVADVDNIVLKWNTLAGAGGYNIYRCNTSDNDVETGDYVRLNTTPVTYNFFTDSYQLEPLTKYYYKVAAVSSTGMEGDAVRVLTWTSWPSTGLFPVQMDVDISRIKGSIIADDVNGDSYPEIFTNGDAGDFVQRGYIIGLDNEGKDLFDIDYNVTTNSGFAAFNASMQAQVAIGDLFANGSRQIVSVSRDMSSARNNYITCHVARDNNGDGLPDVLWQNRTTYTYGRGAAIANVDNSSDGSMEIVAKADGNSAAPYGKDIQVFNNQGGILYTFGGKINYSAVAVADMDGDGDMEVIAGYADGVYIWHHNGTPYSTNPVFSQSGYYFHNTPVVCDLNNDGQKEIIVVASKTTSSSTDGPTVGIVYALKPDGTVLPGWSTSQFPINSRDISQEISVGNLYNDGNLYVVTFATDAVKVWNRNGVLISSTTLSGISGTHNNPVLADVDRDDIAEIIATSQTEGKLYAIKPDGALIVGFPLHTENIFAVSTPCVTDLNNNGKNEIIAASENKVYVWETNGYPSRIEWGMDRFNTQNTGEYLRKKCPEIVITANTVWDSDMEICGDITLQSGTLTLASSCTLKMNRGAKITVNAGAKLAVNGGTITSMYPNSLWQGVVVKGTTVPQNEQTQGSVILTNATIENAIIAINAASGNPSNGNGGIIQATGTTFVNNVQAINYGSYENKDLNGAVINNTGTFTRCTFSINANNYFAANGKTFFQHVKLNKVRGIKFYGCTFNNESGIGGKGIYAQDAGFMTVSSCHTVIMPCGDCHPDFRYPAVFSGLSTAIDVNNSGNTYGVYIDQCDFKDIVTAANIKSVPNFRFIRNSVTGFTGSGLVCESSSGYKIEQNRFEGAAGYSTSGITVKNSSTAPNLLYRNSFKNVRRAISVSGNNFNSLNQTGLLIKCNTFEDSYRDMELQANATINVNQGSLLEGADNCFNRTLNSGLYVTTPFGLTYFHSNAPCHVPVNPVNVGLIINTASANKCQSTLCSPTTDLEIISSHEEYLFMQHEYDALLKEFEAGGYGYILANLNSSGEYSEQEMTALQFSAKISELSNRMRELSDNAISIILQDSVLNTDLLKEWYSVVRTPFAKYALAETHLFTGSYAEADAILHNIPAQFVLSEFEQTENNSYMQFHSIRKELQLSGREWSELKEDEIAALQAIAEEDAGRGSAMAKGVLCFFYGICYEDEMLEDMPEQVPPSMTKATPHPDETLPETSTVSVYPNPFGTEITVMVNSPETVITRVELYDAFGNNILHQVVNQMQKTVSTGNIPTGVYVLKTYLSNGEVVVERVMKQRIIKN